MILEFPVHLPRNAFNPRNRARAGDVWRAFQDVATEGSARAGWPPDRYVRNDIGFVVRSMVVVHDREIPWGEPVTGRTWVHGFRRGILTTRECRLSGPDGPIAAASQEWVHVRASEMKPVRASDELLAAFPAADGEPSPVMPAMSAVTGAPTHTFSFRCWHTWMDPLAHVNHPVYVDWCDEGTSRAMARAGLDPVALVPVAERVDYRSGVVAPEEVTVRTTVAGVTEQGDVVLDHVIEKGANTVAATARTVRRLADGGTDALLLALR